MKLYGFDKIKNEIVNNNKIFKYLLEKIDAN
jgi:hypothetical protein